MSKIDWNRPAQRDYRERRAHPCPAPRATPLRFISVGEGERTQWFVEGPEGLAYQRVQVGANKRWVTLGGVVWARPGYARYAIR